MPDLKIYILDDSTKIALAAAKRATDAAATASGAVDAVEDARDGALAEIGDAGTTQVDAVNDAASAINAQLPFNNGQLGGASYGSFPVGLALSADKESVLLPAGVSVNLDLYLTPDQIATSAALRFFLQIVSGSAASAFTFKVGRWDAGGTDLPLTPKSNGMEYIGTKPTGKTFLRFAVTAPTDTYVKRLTATTAPIANPVVDPHFIALAGEASLQADTTRQITNFIAPADYVDGVYPVPSSGSTYASFLPAPGFDPADDLANGDRLWVTYETNFDPDRAGVNFVPLDASLSVVTFSAGSRAIRLGFNTWAQCFDINSVPMAVLAVASNTTTSGLTISNIAFWKGRNPPITRKVSKSVAFAISRGVAQGRRDQAGVTSITFHTDSTGRNAGYPDPGAMLKGLAGPGYSVRSLGVPGASVTQIMTTGGLLPIPVTVSGGIIPAATTPVAISYPTGYDPITANTYNNPDWANEFYLAGVLGRIVVTAYTGFNPAPGSIYFQRLAVDPRGIATDVTAGTPLVARHYLETRGGKRIILIESVNGFGSYAGTQQQLIEAVTANMAASDVILLPSLTPTPYGLPTKPSWLTGHRLQNCYVDWNATNAAVRARAQLAPVTWVPAGGDLAAMAAGTVGIPASARSGDGYHNFPASGAYMSIQNIVRSTQFQAWAR